MKKTLFSALLICAFVLPITAFAAVDLSKTCDITLDNDTSDWDDLDSLVEDETSTTGTTYYWADDLWQDEPPDNYEYSTNVDQMADLETIKMCNDMTTLFLYVDTQHPAFGLYDVAQEKYREYPDPEEMDIGMPQEFDNWMVIKMNKQGANKVFFYGVHLYSAVGDAGLESGPTKNALYEDDGDGIFNPNLDTELVEFDTGGGKDDYEGDPDDRNKEFDQEGGLEVSMDLVNEDGEGLFTSTAIEYGDTLNVTIAMYPNSAYQVSAASSLISSVEETEEAEYKIKKVGVQDVTVPKNKRKKKKATVKYSAVNGASEYFIKLMKRNGNKVRLIKTTKVKKVMKKLKKNKKYSVKVRAKISSVKTPWSETINFRTKK